MGNLYRGRGYYPGTSLLNENVSEADGIKQKWKINSSILISFVYFSLSDEIVGLAFIEKKQTSKFRIEELTVHFPALFDLKTHLILI